MQSPLQSLGTTQKGTFSYPGIGCASRMPCPSSKGSYKARGRDPV
jgi:hypothetical protein